MTTVYLSNNRIQVIGGQGGSHAVVTKCVPGVDVSSCMFNDRVTDKESFCRKLTDVFETNGLSRKNVVLVLNTPQIILRELKVPKKDKAGTQTFVANSFSDVERTSNPVYAYQTLHEDRKTKLCSVLAAMSDADYLSSWAELFSGCGISLASVRPSLFCALSTLRGKTMQGKTCIVLLMEEAGFTSILFIRGEYRYSTYNRISSEHGTPDFAREVARSVSMIMQFVKAQRVDDTTSEVLLAGFREEDLNAAEEAIDRMGGNISSSALNEADRVSISNSGERICECLTAAGGLLKQEKQADMLFCLRKQKAEKKQIDRKRKAGIVLAALFLVMLGVSIALQAEIRRQQSSLKRINSYLNSGEVKAKTDYSAKLASGQGEVNARKKSVKEAGETLSTYPLPNSDVKSSLEKCAQGLVTVEIVKYTSETGELKINTSAKDVDKIHQFIEILGEQSEFKVEEYSGYEYVDTTATWSVYVVISLSPDAGRGNKS